MIWCEQRFDNAKSCLCRANCPVVLSCAVRFCYRCYVLIGSTGVLSVWGKKQGAVKDQIHVEKEKKRKVVHNNTYYNIRYCFMFERKHTAQHDTAPQRRAHGTAPHGQGAVKDQIHVEKEKRRKVVHNTYYNTRYCSMFERKHTAQHDTAPQRRAHGTAPHRTAPHRTAPHGATLRCRAA